MKNTIELACARARAVVLSVLLSTCLAYDLLVLTLPFARLALTTILNTRNSHPMLVASAVSLVPVLKEAAASGKERRIQLYDGEIRVVISASRYKYCWI